MTNPETRKTRQTAASEQQHNQVNGLHTGNELAEVNINAMDAWRRSTDECEYSDEDDSLTQTPDSDDDINDDDSDNDEGELSLGTCSSFSLQECIDEFKARRIRRVSQQSRELVVEKQLKGCGQKSNLPDSAEADLINQNRTNKEHERKCKPCKNGFCYCFTSDSGDAVAVTAPGHSVRQHKRNRKSESNQVSYAAQQRHTIPRAKEKRRQSAPPILKEPTSTTTRSGSKIKTASTCQDQMRAVSRLGTANKKAPLIHIIQELRNNCVVSEVRINKHKIQAHRSRSLSSKPSPKKTHFDLSKESNRNQPKRLSLPSTPLVKRPTPSAPTLDKISELDSLSEPFIYSTSLDTSAKSSGSGRRHKAAGLLLQKRLSHAPIQFKPRNLSEPPPKPPRSNGLVNSDTNKASVSSLASTTSSVRQAEQVVDDFLRSKGIASPDGVLKKATKSKEQINSKEQTHSKGKKERANEKAKKQQQEEKERHEIKLSASGDGSHKNKRNSYPLIQPKTKPNVQKTLPTYPSLSDFERLMEKDTRQAAANNDKNSHQATEKHVKQHTFGWKEPEEAESIQQMLNYDANANKRQFRSQAVQAGPQAIGWQIPPKTALDTVDGGLMQNLDANISKKMTPVKTYFATSSAHNDTVSQKYLFRKQFKNFMNSPWSNKTPTFATDEKPKSSLKSSSQSFLNNSKKRILRLVSPKKENRERRSEPFRKTPLRSIGIQTSKEEMRSLESSSTPLSPPGSYFSAVQTSQQSTTVTNESQEAPQMNFNFDRTVHSPPKKPKELIRGKLNFPPPLDRTSNGSPDAKTYRSFQSELDQDVTLSKMGLILSNIRAKLEASDDHAERTFREIGQREQQFAAGLDCTDGEQRVRHQSRDLQRKHRHFAIDEREEEPIYSEIEEDSIHILSSPNFDNKTANIEHFPAEQDPSALYAKVAKTPKQTNNRVTVTEQQQLQQSQGSQSQQQLHQDQEEQNFSKHPQHKQKQQPQHHQKKQQKQEQPHQQQQNQQQVNHGHQQQQIYEQQPKQHKQQHQPQQHKQQQHQPQQHQPQQHQPQQHQPQQHQPQQHKQQQHQQQHQPQKQQHQPQQHKQQQHQPQQHKQQQQKQHEQQYYNQPNNQPQKQHQKQQTLEQHQIQSHEQQQQHLKQQQLLSPNTRLAKCFQESLKSKIKLKPLPPLKTTTTHAPFHASSSSPSLPSFSHSLNNIRVKEQHSPPKHNRHLSKSDLSLHRSEIFLENLCRSELIINGSSDPLPLEKVSNVNLNESYMSTDSRSEARNLTSQNEDEYVDEAAETAEAGDIDFDDNDDRDTYYTNTDLNHNIEPDNYDNYYDDDVSYELPGNEAADLSQNTADSRYAVNHSRPLTNQSTPKKSQTKPQTFTTKENVDKAELSTNQHQPNSDTQHLQQNPCPSNTDLPPQKEQQQQQKEGSLDINKPCLLSLPLPQQHLSQSNSCPNTPRGLPPIPPDNESNACTASLIEVTASYTNDTTQPVCCKSTLARYQRLKNAFRMSLRRSKKFVKTESKRLSSTLSFPAAAVAAAVTTGSFSNKSRHNQSQSSASEMLIDSTFNLDFLFALDDDDQPVEQQLAKAVTICRQLPDLEISPEMVEAERLLLFSTLRREAAKWPTIPGTVTAQSYEQQRPQRGCIYVDAMRIPTRTDASQDLFFNYFYICTFYCGGVITSTQSVECRNQEAIFIDCGIEFAALDSEAEVNCEIFMLRLRKVSTLSFEYTKKSILNLSRSSMTSSCDDIVSRFRLHGSFTIRPSDFLPYEYVELASKSSGSICLRSSTSCRIAITPRTKSTNLSTEALLTGRADMRFPKFTLRGFLNVQQPENQHHWNRRWCTLDGMFLRVWQDIPLDEEISDAASQPLLQFYLHLRGETGTLESASPELCARPRSFCLDCCVVKSTDDEAESTATRTTRSVFLAAESQNDLSTWLLKLNEVLDFTAKWMKR